MSTSHLNANQIAMNNLFNKVKGLQEKLNNIQPDCLCQSTNSINLDLPVNNSITHVRNQNVNVNTNANAYQDPLNHNNSMDKLDVLEYSLNNVHNNNSISQSHIGGANVDDDDDSNVSHSIDIKNYKHLHLHFSSLTFDDPTYSNTCNSVPQLFYIECKVPIMKGINNELVYNSFKIIIQNQIEDNKVDIKQDNTQMLNLSNQENFSALTNASITFYLHKVVSMDNKAKNVDVVIASGEMKVNEIFLAKQFEYTLTVKLTTKLKDMKGNKQHSQQYNAMMKKARKGGDGVGVLNNNNNNVINVAHIDMFFALYKDNTHKQHVVVNKKEDDVLKQTFPFKQEIYINNNNDSVRMVQHKETNAGNANVNEINNINDDNLNSEEIKTDLYNETLILYLQVTNLNVSSPSSYHQIYSSENPLLNYNNNSLPYPNNNTNSNPQVIQQQQKNYYIMHKIFPSQDSTMSNIVWNNPTPNFNYSLQMPFQLNQYTANLLDSGMLVIELWNKTTNDDVVGVVKLDMRNILDSLKVDETTITVHQLYRNTFPYVIYDDSYPVTMFGSIEESSTQMQSGQESLFLKVLVAIGSAVQINNFIQRMKQLENSINTGRMVLSQQQMSLQQQMPSQQQQQCITTHTKEIHYINQQQQQHMKDNNVSYNDDMNKQQHDNSLNPFIENQNQQQQVNNNNINNFINEGMQTDGFNSHFDDHDNNNNISRANDINVEEILEHNKKEIENLNTKYKLQQPTNTMNFDKSTTSNFYKKDVVNPFLVPEVQNDNDSDNNNNNNINNIEHDIGTAGFKVSHKDEQTENEIFSLADKFPINNNNNNNDKDFIQPKPQIKPQINKNIIDKPELDNILHNKQNTYSLHNEIDNDNNIEFIPHKEQENEIKQQGDDNNINNDHSIKLDNNNNNTNDNVIETSPIIHKPPPMINNNLLEIIRHKITIEIDKIVNCQYISKLKHPTYISYQFSTDDHPLRSENLYYSSFNAESSIIEVDMKSTHSLLLPASEKIKDYLKDFTINLNYNTSSSDIPKTIGTINIPVEEFYSLVSDTPIMSRTEYIHGAEKTERSKCIIGKVKLTLKYEYAQEHTVDRNEINEEIFMEKETICNRKVPAIGNLIIKIKNFQSYSLFEEYYRKNFSFYFVISPFGEVPTMEKKHGKRQTSKKYNVLSPSFNECLSFKLEFDRDIVDYFKCRNLMIYLYYKTSLGKNNMNDNNKENDSDDDDEDDNNDINEIDNLYKKNGKNLIGKGTCSLDGLLSSAETLRKSIHIKQLGNMNSALGELNIEINLDNEMNGNNYSKNNSSSLFMQSMRGNFDNNKPYNLDMYLNGKFIFIIDFNKLLYNIKSIYHIQTLIQDEFYFMFKLGKNIKRISPKFSLNNCTINSIGIYDFEIALLNYCEIFELDLRFDKKQPFDLYHQFNESVLEIKLYQNETTVIGCFYIDIHKLISSSFFYDNIFYSKTNLINLIEPKNNAYKDAKLDIDLKLIKCNDDSLTIINYNTNTLNNGYVNSNNYNNYYQMLFSNEFINSNLLNIDISKVNDIDYLRRSIFNYKGMDLFSFVNENIIEVFSNETINEYALKKLFELLTKYNYDIFEFYYTHQDVLFNISNDEIERAFVTGFHAKDDDLNMLNYLKEVNDTVYIGLNQNKNTAHIDALTYAMFINNYKLLFNNNNNNMINEKGGNFLLSSVTNNNNVNVNVNNDSQFFYQNSSCCVYREERMRKMIIKVQSGMNIIKPNSELHSRPNCFFILEFDDKNYKSEVIKSSSQPNWNDELEIKISASDYDTKVQSLPIIITVFSQEEFGNEDEYGESSNANNSIYIGTCELYPYKILPFLNEDNQCDDFYNVINNETNTVQGQLNITIKLDSAIIQSVTNRSLLGNEATKKMRITNTNNNNNNVNSNLNMFKEEEDENDLRRKLEEAMNTCDNLTLELQDKGGMMKLEQTHNNNINNNDYKSMSMGAFRESERDKGEDSYVNYSVYNQGTNNFNMNNSLYNKGKESGLMLDRSTHSAKGSYHRGFDRQLLNRIEKVMKGKK